MKYLLLGFLLAIGLELTHKVLWLSYKRRHSVFLNEKSQVKKVGKAWHKLI